ncbi:zinc transport system substrate-binding protein [Nocardioides szechwanensis]|uniref:Zinc transport system substrate-binding protein n=1 Tax=Nocardioides szechwanensis TaxID=1005944 RepID=A0A1H0I043_9ACTN|nr:metal ABC transporter substrate-binding protein [Nocardioides szechwanensis]SDO24763.1 zinc transport system substrate-binding protein [Nocardioides szechwanensis]
MSRRHLVALSLSLPLVLAGCSALGDESDDGLQVATAFYPLQYAAERVAGDLAEVDNLTVPGKEPHDLELTVSETAVIVQADLVVFEGGFQPAVDDGIDQNATGTVLDVTTAADLLPIEDGHEEESEEEQAEHDHGDLDPHFWQDPLRMAAVGDAVAEELAEIDPEHADDFRANAADLRADLEALDTEYAEGLADCERDTVVVSHDAFGYLAKYGLHLAPVAGLSPEAEPTLGDLADLQQLIDDEGITTVFSETLGSPRFTRPLADDLGLRTDVLDPLEGLASEGDTSDYLSLMRDNLAALQEANGCR